MTLMLTAGAERRGQLQLVVRQAPHFPISGTLSARQIFLASVLLISVWRGTASTWPVFGLHQREWLASFALEVAAVLTEVAQQVAALHLTVTVS
jgi:hypothetical protein